MESIRVSNFSCKNCLECTYYHTCKSYYGGTGCKMNSIKTSDNTNK